MRPEEMIRYLIEYGDAPKFNSDDYMPLFEVTQPEKINYADKLERNEKGEIIYSQITVEELEKKINQSQKLSFKLRENMFVKKTKSDFWKQKSTTLDSKLDKDIHKKVAICKIDETIGHGLFVIDPKGLPKGSEFLYSSVISPKKELSIVDAMDPYGGEDKDYVISSFRLGGIARMVNGAPPNLESFTFYKYDEKKVATANARLILTKSIEPNVRYRTLRDLSYGEQILGEWTNTYWDSLFNNFRCRFALFNISLNSDSNLVIKPEHYQLPIELNDPKNTKVTVQASYALLEKHIKEEQPFGIEYEGMVHWAEPSELKKILDYLPKQYDAMFYISIPKIDDWKNFNRENLQSPSPFYLRPHLLTETRISENYKLIINSAALKAFKTEKVEGYEAAIKLWTWLIIHELQREKKNHNEKFLGSWCWSLANAYKGYSYYKEALFLVNMAKAFNYSVGKITEFEKKIQQAQEEQQNKESSQQGLT